VRGPIPVTRLPMAASGHQATLEKRPTRRAPRAQPALHRPAVTIVDAARNFNWR
jgi:hypothetical protein